MNKITPKLIVLILIISVISGICISVVVNYTPKPERRQRGIVNVSREIIGYLERDEKRELQNM